MKALLTMILGVVILRTCNTPSIDYARPTPVSFQQFYDELSPYGDWVETPNYGYAWVPDVDDDFRPYYTNGNWAATDLGNTWVSDYPWGWAPFHYGNWAYTDPHGWTWVPGYDWAPAQVSWRQGDGFYGWAPLLPGLALSKGLNGYNPPADWWVFVPQNRLYSDNVSRFWPGPQYNPSILPATTYITNVYKGKRGNNYIFGPRADEYAKLTGKNIKVHKIVDVAKPGSRGKGNEALHVYRPKVKKDRGAAPTKVMQNWAGKSQRGNSVNARDGQPNQKTNARGPQQNKALPGNKQNGHKQMEARGRQNASPERKPSSPHKATPRKAPERNVNKNQQRQQQSARPAQQKNSGASARQQQKPQQGRSAQHQSGPQGGKGDNGGGKKK